MKPIETKWNKKVKDYSIRLVREFTHYFYCSLDNITHSITVKIYKHSSKWHKYSNEWEWPLTSIWPYVEYDSSYESAEIFINNEFRLRFEDTFKSFNIIESDNSFPFIHFEIERKYNIYKTEWYSRHQTREHFNWIDNYQYNVLNKQLELNGSLI